MGKTDVKRETPEEVRERLADIPFHDEDELGAVALDVQIEQTYQLARIADSLKLIWHTASGISDVIGEGTDEIRVELEKINEKGLNVNTKSERAR